MQITLAATILNTTEKFTKHEKLFNIKLKKPENRKNYIFVYIIMNFEAILTADCNWREVSIIHSPLTFK